MYRAFFVILVVFVSFSVIQVTLAANNTEPGGNLRPSKTQNRNEICLASCRTEICQACRTNSTSNVSATFNRTPVEDGISDSKPGLYDNFEDGVYDLTNGALSPNGKWHSIDNGYGAMGVKTDDRGTNVFFLHPKAAESKNETYSGFGNHSE